MAIQFQIGKMREEEEMEMRAKLDIELGQDITPPILPLSFSLYDSFLSSHCSSCFSPLPRITPSFPNNPRHVPLYCSSACSSSYSSTADSFLPHSLPPACPGSSDLRTALRLLHSLPPTCPNLHRINGLLTNYHKLTSSPEFAAKIRQGAIVMAAARKSQNRGKEEEEQNDKLLLEEAVLSLVITNAVEVQDGSGRSLGIAVYDTSFSWINHSCSPNACYRFSISPPNAVPSGDDSTSKLRIVPSVSGEEGDVFRCLEHTKGNRGYQYGPKIIVRSIKRISKGEQVCISYTDLLQPKAMRQSELWSKYQFTCSCPRCSVSPSTYIDRALEEISSINLGLSSSSFDVKLYRAETTRRLSDYVDETISEFLSVGDPQSCCDKLESMLDLGLTSEQLESNDVKSQLNFRLHPFHHLALNAYTTLASAYQIRSSDFSALATEIDEYQLKAFDLSRTSAAYSLLLAGATHHLFRSESSLIASAANFWTNAGESLLTLARSSLWNSSVKWGSPISEVSAIAKHKCSKCLLMDILDAKLFLSQVHRAKFENISRDFLDCLNNMIPNIWRFLVHGCRYLEMIADPIDFRWLGLEWDVHAHVKEDDEDSILTEDSIIRHHAEWCTNEGRINVYQVGIHCLLYGGFLAHICYGQNSPLANHVLNILYPVENSIH